ncbi:hypothetical protein NEMBOFW57_008945 [Staphylotrichum longicolle]|uniref:Seipin n=1 Tax=Staphylotrichum longicolle TaxID=669026 RepID=A0AAD4ESB5_9PEZI|nr:hypothetical protein NEMBOFW57_008945 [Staphylotrichum longicolle]
MSTFESLDQAWQSLQIIVREVTSGGKQVVRGTGRLARDTVSSPRVQKAVIGTTLLAIAGILLYIPAALGYLYFYYKFLPELETTAPVHLQYGVGPNPFGIAPLTGLANRQAYDITVSLTLPRSPPNLDRGNFMIALHLLTTPPGQTTAAAPARVLFLPLNLLLFSTTTTTHRSAISTVRLTVPMAEDLVLVPQYHADATTTTATRLPESLLLEVQAGQDIQVYDARVTLVARLKGLRGFMYRWRATAFVLFTGGFWVVEMGTLVGVVVGVLVVLGGKGVSSSSTSPPSGFDEGVVKKEEEEEEEEQGQLAKVPVFEAEESDEADDEAEEGGGVKDVGTGTSFSGHMSREGVRRRSGAGHGQ